MQLQLTLLRFSTTSSPLTDGFSPSYSILRSISPNSRNEAKHKTGAHPD